MGSSMTPPDARAQKWDRQFNTELIKQKLDVEKPTMLQRATSKFASLFDMESAVKQVLNSAGTSANDTANYLNFSRQVWKADQTYKGEALQVEVAIYLSKWTARGLSAAVCETIRNQVFTIPAPVGP